MNLQPDALTDILQTIRLTANTLFYSSFAAPWGINVQRNKAGLFHIVLCGECYLVMPNGKQILLEQGDIVAFPTGGGHILADHPDSPTVCCQEAIQKLQQEPNWFDCSEANTTTLLCGSFSYDSSIEHPFIKSLPCFIHAKMGKDLHHESIGYLISALVKESNKPATGSSAITNRLTEVLFIELIREHMRLHPEQSNYIAALGDPQIGRALNLIHNDDNAQWTVNGLSDSLAMSRTSFTSKFVSKVGVPPKQYLLNWRMQKSKFSLEKTQKPMIEIALEAGYSSEAAFSKAFKQFFGTTPGAIKLR